jgi:hypothetical protein
MPFLVFNFVTFKEMADFRNSQVDPMNSLRSLSLLICLSVATASYGQMADIFDTKLYSEKIDRCELINTYIGKKPFKYFHSDTTFFSVSYYDNKGEIFGNWVFVSREDSLDQISFSSLELPITQDWYNKLRKQADSLISVFKAKYGEPARTTVNEKNFYRVNQKVTAGAVVKAMWLIGGQKLKVVFEIGGEHNEFHYLLSVQRFRDYYGNQKLPPWWNGY